jgi:hypothetical protein
VSCVIAAEPGPRSDAPGQAPVSAGAPFLHAELVTPDETAIHDIIEAGFELADQRDGPDRSSCDRRNAKVVQRSSELMRSDLSNAERSLVVAPTGKPGHL